jgi:hypothetical protein
MAHVLALIADLMFGSRVQSALTAAGDQVELLADEQRLRASLAHGREHGGAAGSVLLVDLTDAQLDGSRVLERLVEEGALTGVRTLGFYSHVDVSARERAKRAGFELLVPRSRMAREAPELVARLAATP